MKLLVCVSKTPDTTAKISFSGDNTTFNSAGVQYIMNPYDEWYALVRALEIKETLGGTLTLINVGGAEDEQIIRKGLAIGGDDAVRINANPQSALYTAKQIAEYAKDKNYDIVFLGKETIDYNGSEVGAMIAEYLDLPYISYATSLEITGNQAVISRDIEGGSEVLEVQTPFVISAAKGLAEQRIPNMKGIMQARTRPLTVVEPIAFDDQSTVAQFELPKAKTGVKLINAENMDELVRLLHEEAKVI
jgi:electron transfer flavoprotein beta subunit